MIYPIWFYIIQCLLQPLPKEENNTLPSNWFYNQRAYPLDSIPQSEYVISVQQVVKQSNARKRSQLQKWKFAGPTNIGGRITDIEASPLNDNLIYAGSASGGVFKTINKGGSWIPVFDSNPILSIGDMAIHPTNPDILYVGTGEANGGGGSVAYDGNGIFKTSNGGDSWDYLGLEFSGSISKIIINPNKPDVIYAAAMGRLFSKNNQRGIFKTINGGDTWQSIFYRSDSVGVIDMAMDPLHPDTIYAATWERSRMPSGIDYGGPECGIYRSFDGGKIWVRLSKGLPEGNDLGRIGLAVAPNQPNRIFAFYVDESGDFLGIYRSDNYGENWSRLGGRVSTSTFGWWFGKIYVDPKNANTVFVLGLFGYKSMDGGNSFVNITDNFNEDVHVDQHALYIHPLNTTQVLLGNDGGLYNSINGGLSWSKINNLPITQFYTCHIDNKQPERLYGGTQDNSSMRTFSGVDQWTIISGGDGFVCEVDPIDNNYVYTESQYGAFIRSTDGGINFVNATDGILGSDRSNWKTPFVLDPKQPSTIYLGTNRLYKSINRGAFWSPISPSLTPETNLRAYGTITSISVSPIDPLVIFCGTDLGLAWVTLNGGQDWKIISDALPTRWITSITADPLVKSKVYITISGYRYNESLPHVFVSDNYGSSWKDISKGLPPVPVNDLIIDPENAGHIVVATDAGIWRSSNDGRNWQLLGDGMPITIFNDLHFHKGTRKLAAASYGRGMYTYELELPVQIETALKTGFEIQAFPNPFTEIINIKGKIKQSSNYRISLYTMEGKIIEEKMNYFIANNEFNTQLNIEENVPPGIYLLSLSSAQGIHGAIRIIKY
jgi:photosystem II stability/assembly factor-like uncharacterized protein